MESDPIEEGDDDDDIEMLEEYSEEGDSEGEKEERGAVEVIDVDATSSEDGESIPPFGDEAEVSRGISEWPIGIVLTPHCLRVVLKASVSIPTLC